MDRREHLRRLLSEHPPADALEAEHRDRMLALADAPGDPFSRDHFEPGHFTASTFVLSPDGGSLLLIFHGKLHRWLQPGGHIDPEDADVLAAAAREVAEETGITDAALDSALDPALGALLDVDVHTIPANPRKGEASHEHFDVRILMRARSLDYRAGSDAKDARWVPLADVNAIDSDESVMRAVQKLLRRQAAAEEG